MSEAEIAEAEQALLTAQGRRQAALELTEIMIQSGIHADNVETIMEGDTGSKSPKKHAAAHTGRFLLETALRRDVDALARLISLPFRFEDTVVETEEELAAIWFSAIAAEGPPLAKPDPYKPVYQMVAHINEFTEIDPDQAGRVEGLDLTDNDFAIGMIVAFGNEADPINYLLRWNDGAIKVAGVWT